MTKTTTIQISIYDWEIMEELVYEAEISSIEEFISLTYRFDKKVKYKKATDKNWYYAKTMVKRLFKKDLEGTQPSLKFVTTNDLNKIEEEKLKKKQEQEEYENWLGQFDYREGRDGFGNREYRGEPPYDWDNDIQIEPDFTIEQIKSMSEDELANRLVDLYIEDYYISKTDYDSYNGPFKGHLNEIAYIELQISSGIADRAHYQAMEGLCGGKLTFKPKRLPMSEIFRLTDNYELEYIGRAF